MKTKSEKGSETRQKMIDTACELFHQNGISRTSVDQILEASGTGKSQFYHYFESKEGLVRAVIDFYCGMLKAGEGPNKVPLETLDDLEEWFSFHVDMQRSFGFERCCPVGTIANDLEGDQEMIRQDLCITFDVVRDRLVEFFTQLKSKNEIKENADPNALAEFCLTTVQGGFLISKVRRDSFPVENAVKHAMIYLRSFST